MSKQAILEPVRLELLNALAGTAPAADFFKTNGESTPQGKAQNGQQSGYVHTEASDTDDAPEGFPFLRVADWLNDHGVGFRLKDGVDSLGRKVYVLKECPFDSSHGDPDSCIMQAASGALSAKCLHNSCQGRGWQKFKEAIGAPKAKHYDGLPEKKKKKRKGKAAAPGPDNSDTEQASSGLPQIQHNRRQLRDVTDDALTALLARNNPPRTYQRGGLLTRFRVKPETKAPFLEAMEDAAIRGLLARCADWHKLVETQSDIRLEADAPPTEVVKDIASLPDWEGVPMIENIIECPVFARDGQLVNQQGYHADSHLWYHQADGLDIPPIPESPARADIDAARALLQVDLLGDFPLIDDASKAHALAALLLPFVRSMIDGPTPLHLFDAPTEGTGKTLLASAISIVSTGREAEAVADAKDSDEYRKRITAVLAEAPIFVLLDNINKTLDSSALAAVITTRVWKDRILGISKTASLPNNAIWLASGNNTRLSRELIRRTLWCRLDSKTEAPWERTEFRHPNLLKWAKANRGPLVGAALVLCRAWIAAGRPAGKTTLGMFEDWAEVIGGILDVAEVPGLLANAKEFRTNRADVEGEWRAFCSAWWDKYHNQGVGVARLFDLANEQLLLDSVLGDGGARSQRSKLGRAMAKVADRVVGGFRIVHVGQDHSNCQLYRLDKVAEEEHGDAWEPPPEAEREAF